MSGAEVSVIDDDCWGFTRTGHTHTVDQSRVLVGVVVGWGGVFVCWICVDFCLSFTC